MYNVAKNARCPCGSGKQFKRCCLNKPKMPSNKIDTSKVSTNELRNEFDKVINASKPKMASIFSEYASNYESEHILNLITGLQLLPENHGKNIRIELIAKETVINLNSLEESNYKKLQEVISIGYPHHYLEDPPEGLFTENALFHGGNYTVMPGIFAKAGDIFRALSESIFILKNNLTQKFRDELYQGITILLELGQIIFSKAGLRPNMYIEKLENRLIFPEIITDYSFSLEEIESICRNKGIGIKIFQELIVSHTDENFKYEDADLNPLLYKPLVSFNGKIYFPLISAQCGAINEFIINTAIKYKCGKDLLVTYNNLVWNDILQATKKMGWILTNIKLPDSRNESIMREAILQFDNHRLCYTIFIQPHEISNKYDEQKKYEHKESNNKIAATIKYISQHPFYKEYKLLVLVILCEIGRNTYLRIDRPTNGEEMIYFNAFDFLILSKAEKWNALSLYKYAKVYREFSEKVNVISTATIDTYSMYKSKDQSFYFNDEKLPNFITITPGTGADLYREAKQKIDLRGILNSFNGVKGYEVVERFKHFDNIYKPFHRTSNECLLVNSYSFPIWVNSSQEESEFYFVIIEALAFWLDKMKNDLNPLLQNCQFDLLSINLEMDDIYSSEFTTKELLETNTEIIFKSKFGKNEITFRIPAGILKELFNSDNKGERRIMSALLNALNLISKIHISPEEILRIVDSAMPIGPAKMILLFDSKNNMMLDNRWLPSAYYISSAEITLLLDNLIKYLNYPKKIPRKFATAKEKIEFCNYAVTALISLLEKKINEYDQVFLLEALFELNEVLTYRREYNKIIIPSQIFCFGNKKEKIDEILDTENSLVKTSLSTRCLIEFIAAKPISGMKTPSIDEIDFLLAVMNEINNFGMISDSIYFGLDDPEIGLLPSGRIGISKSFYEEKLKPFAIANTQADVEYYMDSFEEKFEVFDTEKVNIDENEAYWDQIDHAFFSDLGIKFTDIIALCKVLILFAEQNKTSVFSIKRRELILKLSETTTLREEEINSILDFLIITERKDFLKAPAGYKNEDVFPWKYNREFSLIKRPLVQYVNNVGDDIIVYGFRNVEAASKQIYNLFLEGRLKYVGKHLKKLLGERNDIKGHAFREKTIQWLKDIKDVEVWPYEVKISPTGHFKSLEDLGDIDILIFDRKRNTVFNIECKRTYQAKNIHEMKTELDSYFGRGGQNKKIQKHIKRDTWLQSNIIEVMKFINTDHEIKIITILLTSEIIPVKFILEDKLPIKMIAFPELKRIGFELLFKE